MKTALLAAALCLVTLSLGCFQSDVRLPQQISLFGDSTPQTQRTRRITRQNIPPADPNSNADLRRENTQLRRRVAVLNGELDQVYATLDACRRRNEKLNEDKRELKADLDKVKRERDRYEDMLDD